MMTMPTTLTHRSVASGPDEHEDGAVESRDDHDLHDAPSRRPKGEGGDDQPCVEERREIVERKADARQHGDEADADGPEHVDRGCPAPEADVGGNGDEGPDAHGRDRDANLGVARSEQGKDRADDTRGPTEPGADLGHDLAALRRTGRRERVERIVAAVEIDMRH